MYAVYILDSKLMKTYVFGGLFLLVSNIALTIVLTILTTFDACDIITFDDPKTKCFLKNTTIQEFILLLL